MKLRAIKARELRLRDEHAHDSGPPRPHRRGERLQGLSALAAVHARLLQQQQLAAESAALERAARAVAERARRLFADAVGPVTRLPPDDRAQATWPRPLPLPRQRELDEQAALQQSLSDEVDVETLLLTDDELSFHRVGVGTEVLNRLRRGHWTIQAELDLHGLRRDEARERLGLFMRDAARRGWRCLRVVHGKGNGSPGRVPVLKAKVQRWLGQHGAVLAFTQASAAQGGAGALIVLLQGSSR